jgi:hypothetical protein
MNDNSKFKTFPCPSCEDSFITMACAVAYLKRIDEATKTKRFFAGFFVGFVVFILLAAPFAGDLTRVGLDYKPHPMMSVALVAGIAVWFFTVLWMKKKWGYSWRRYFN